MDFSNAAKINSRIWNRKKTPNKAGALSYPEFDMFIDYFSDWMSHISCWNKKIFKITKMSKLLSELFLDSRMIQWSFWMLPIVISKEFVHFRVGNESSLFNLISHQLTLVFKQAFSLMKWWIIYRILIKNQPVP